MRSVIRSVQQFSSLGVKIIAQPSRRPSCSAYQKLDEPRNADKLILPKVLRKCLRQLSNNNSSKRMFSISIENTPNCWNCTEKQPVNEELHVFCRNCGLIREIGDSEQV